MFRYKGRQSWALQSMYHNFVSLIERYSFSASGLWSDEGLEGGTPLSTGQWHSGVTWLRLKVASSDELRQDLCRKRSLVFDGSSPGCRRRYLCCNFSSCLEVDLLSSPNWQSEWKLHCGFLAENPRGLSASQCLISPQTQLYGFRHTSDIHILCSPHFPLILKIHRERKRA